MGRIITSPKSSKEYFETLPPGSRTMADVQSQDSIDVWGIAKAA
jgi:hypothetical protein